jgi:hypothetical protein
MAESLDRRSMRTRKPIVHFDDKIAQSLPSTKSKKPAKPAKPAKTTKSALKSQKPPTPLSQASLAECDDDLIEELCSQAQDLDISNNLKAKKKAKVAEIACLNTLSLQEIMDKAKALEEVKFEAFDLGESREPKINIPDNIDPTNPLKLLDLFILLELYSTIADNTNLYAIAHNANTALTPINRRYWWPINSSKIRVLFGIYFYMGVHREPNYQIY